MRDMGKPADRPNVGCEPAQVRREEFVRCFDVGIRQIPLRDHKLMMTAEDVAAHRAGGWSSVIDGPAGAHVRFWACDGFPKPVRVRHGRATVYPS
jgi:hypothetical protein